jgi:hypothetical protein
LMTCFSSLRLKVFKVSKGWVRIASFLSTSGSSVLS